MLRASHSCSLGVVLNAVTASRAMRSALKCFGNALVSCGLNVSKNRENEAMGLSDVVTGVFTMCFLHELIEAMRAKRSGGGFQAIAQFAHPLIATFNTKALFFMGFRVICNVFLRGVQLMRKPLRARPSLGWVDVDCAAVK